MSSPLGRGGDAPFMDNWLRISGLRIRDSTRLRLRFRLRIRLLCLIFCSTTLAFRDSANCVVERFVLEGSVFPCC
jgi:hypothetical protein